MMDIFKRKKFTLCQMQFLLLFIMLQCTILVQFNIFHAPFLLKSSERAEAPLILQEKAAAPAVEDVKKDEFPFQIKKAEPLYNPIIIEAASLNGVDITMVKAIIMAESGYNRKSVSTCGAGGLMQLMPGTAKSLGVKDIFNPEENIHAGVRYYKSLLKRFKGDVKLALAAYNAGARNVHKYNGVPPFKETRQYISKVLGYQRFYKHGPSSEDIPSI